MNHYDLLARPEWTALSVLIVSPYVENTFFRRVIHDLSPQRLIVVIDDGCRSDDIAMVRQLRRRRTSVTVVLAGAVGLVHAKVFHIEWSTTGGNRAHTLIYGSGNATRQAFAGDYNEELMCKARLTAINHSPILAWIRAVQTCALHSANWPQEISPVRDAWLADGIHIRLPGLVIKDANSKASNFDLWLQRGRLLSKFQPDTSFLRVHVDLRRTLPAGELVDRINNIGFETPALKRLRIPYVETADDEEGVGSFDGNWLSHFFIWTQLGYWCSETCFQAENSRFKRKGHGKRRENLKHLSALRDGNRQQEAKSQFLAHIHHLWETLGDEARDYLETCNGTLNESTYGALFEQQLQRDLDLADDAEFRTRYINGYELVELPRFRVDATGWRKFVESFARQLHVKSLKARSQSYIYASIGDAIFSGDEPVADAKDLPKSLRSTWNNRLSEDYGEAMTVGSYIDCYHQRG